MKIPSGTGGQNCSEAWKEDTGASSLCSVVLQSHDFHPSFLQSEENTLGFMV